MELKNFIKKGSFLSNALTLMTGTVIAQAIPIIISPILTRIYSPDDYGLLAVYISIISIFSVLVTGKYELAIVLPKKDKEAINLVGLSLGITVVMSCIVFILFVIWGDYFSILLKMPQLSIWLYYIPFNILLLGVFQTFSYWANRRKHFKRLAIRSVSQATVNSGTSLGLGGLSINGGLIYGNLLGQLVSTSILATQIYREDKNLLKYFSYKKVLIVAKKYKDFPLFSTSSGLLNTVSMQLPIFILIFFFNSTIVGLFSLSQRILNVPMSVIGNSIAQVYYQQASQIDNPKELKLITFKLYQKLLLIGLIPMSIVLGFGDILFSIVFGADWTIAGTYAQILSIWLLFVFVSSPLSNLYVIQRKQKEGLYFNTFIFVARTISLLVGALIFNDPLITIMLYSFTSAFLFFCNCIYLLKLVGIRITNTLVITIKAVGFSTILILLLRWIVELYLGGF